MRPGPPVHAALALWNGGAGEAEVISWALAYPDFFALLDDQKARRLASPQGVSAAAGMAVEMMVTSN